jgi:hypothetical protein
MPRSEHQEQTVLVAMVRQHFPGAIIAAVPNGGKRGRAEAVRLKAEGVLAGFPDLVLMEPRGGYHGLVCEMKRVGGRLVKHQRELLDQLAERGYYVLVGDLGALAAFHTVKQYMKGELIR